MCTEPSACCLALPSPCPSVSVAERRGLSAHCERARPDRTCLNPGVFFSLCCFSHCCFVIEALKSLPSNEESRDHQARCIWFLDTLIRFRAQKVIKRKSKPIITFYCSCFQSVDSNFRSVLTRAENRCVCLMLNSVAVRSSRHC